MKSNIKVLEMCLTSCYHIQFSNKNMHLSFSLQFELNSIYDNLYMPNTKALCYIVPFT